MPHIIVEYTDTLDVDVPRLLNDLHHDLAARDTVDINAIKTRAISIQNCVVGAAETADKFMHIALKLLPGRDEALKREMTQGLFDVAHPYLANQDVVLSVESLSLEAETYIK